jgi:hypothetical protein
MYRTESVKRDELLLVRQLITVHMYRKTILNQIFIKTFFNYNVTYVWDKSHHSYPHTVSPV